MPKITAGNRLYFYQLLSERIGTGVQAPLSRVEEVLAEEDVLPEDVECADVAELLAAMPDLVKLTVFKKGRTYATLLQNDELDGILARLAAPQVPGEKAASGGPKTWKRKKGPKDPKPAKPRRRRTEEKAAEVPDSGADSLGAGTAETVQPVADSNEVPEAILPAVDSAKTPETISPAAASVEAVVADVPDSTDAKASNEPQVDPVVREVAETPVDTALDSEPVQNKGQEPDTPPEPAVEMTPEAPSPVAPKPSITLTITYDPREDKGASDASADPDLIPLPWELPEEEPKATEPVAAVDSAAADLAVSEATVPAPAAPEPASRADRDLPQSLSAEVLMRDEQLRVLYQLLPIDADPMATLDEDWRVARSCGLVSGTRGKASFPLRYLHEDGTPVEVTIKRSSKNPGGKRWALAYVDGDDGTGASHEAAGVEGLPTADEGAWADLRGTSRPGADAMSPVRELAQFCNVGTWDSALGTLATMAAPERWSFPGEGAGKASRYGILREYLAVTFHRVREEGKLLVAPDGSLAAFNTGLLTPFAEDVYAVLTPRKGDIPWQLGFAVAGSGEAGMLLAATFPQLPQPARYLAAVDDVVPQPGRLLILDTNALLSAQLGRLPQAFLAEHVGANTVTADLYARTLAEKGDGAFTDAQLTALSRAIKADPGLYRRMGEALKDAVELALRRAGRSYRLAVPAYDPSDGRMRLLLPLCLVDDSHVDCAAVVTPMPSGAYQVSAVMALPRAYACARVVSAEQPSWLRL